MDDYVLLLRGVNVGGNRRVVMAELKAQLAAVGATTVVSYINSGNLIFSYDGDAAKLVADVLVAHYDFSIDHLVLTKAAYLDEIAQAPDWWQAADDRRHNALFKLPGYQVEFDADILSSLTDLDQAVITDHVIFWCAPQKVHYHQSAFAKIMGTPFYKQVSIRNQNTTVKLAKLLNERD
ncbi:DUF1697 domain-containing protein [Secundilactobacillus muriivasis]